MEVKSAEPSRGAVTLKFKTITGGEKELVLTKEDIEGNEYDFKKVKEILFLDELNANKNVRFVYQGKMLRDADKIKSVRRYSIIHFCLISFGSLF